MWYCEVLNSCGNSKEKEITFGRGNWGVGQKNCCYTDWLSTGIKDFTYAENKGKDRSQEFGLVFQEKLAHLFLESSFLCV